MDLYYIKKLRDMFISVINCREYVICNAVEKLLLWEGIQGKGFMKKMWCCDQKFSNLEC